MARYNRQAVQGESKLSRADLDRRAVASVPFMANKSATGHCPFSIHAPHGAPQCKFMSEINIKNLKFESRKTVDKMSKMSRTYYY